MNKTLMALALCATAMLVAIQPARADSGPLKVTNGGFEDGAAGWRTSAGKNAAVSAQAGGHTGAYRLTQQAATAFRAETRQTVSGLRDGYYTLRAWVRTGTASQSRIALKDCGSPDAATFVPASGSEWLHIAVTQKVTRGRCTISLGTDAAGGGWADFDDVTLASGKATLSVKGADTSSLPKSEANGGRYLTASGKRADALKILHAAGADYVRLKVWVDPVDGYNDKAHVLAMARRVKALGMGLLVDFHYSDAWADPGKQYKPAAWTGLDYAHLKTALYDHTYDVLNALKAQGTTADMVQVGNEINDGILWEEGRSSHFADLAGLLNAGYQAVKDVSDRTKVVLHVAEGGNNGLFRWWFDSAAANGVRYDVIGVSYYPYWHGTLGAFQANIDDIADRYGKPVLIAETAYPFTDAENDPLTNIITSAEPYPNYPATRAGQTAMFRDVLSIVQAVPDGRGLGAVYWEPTWTAVPGNGWDPADPSSGNGWENQALFGYDNRALPAMGAFAHQ